MRHIDEEVSRVGGRGCGVSHGAPNAYHNRQPTPPCPRRDRDSRASIARHGCSTAQGRGRSGQGEYESTAWDSISYHTSVREGPSHWRNEPSRLPAMHPVVTAELLPPKEKENILEVKLQISTLSVPNCKYPTSLKRVKLFYIWSKL
jgi:hypothetical protein